MRDFDILLTMRERTAFPETLLHAVSPNCACSRHLGAYVATLDLERLVPTKGSLCATPRAVAPALPLRPLNWPLAC